MALDAGGSDRDLGAPNRSASSSELFEQARNGNRRALGRLLTLIETGGEAADEITELTHPETGRAHVIGITGAPGAGKSTMTGQLLKLLSDSGHQSAVLAVDPSSPLTGGAILGDRIRMDHLAGTRSFIRSMATRGHFGGLALAVPAAVRAFDAAGYDPVLIETVGVGQVEVDVAATADTTVVVVTPGWGDAVQANKAGLLEVADVFVVNKSDRPGASDARRDLELMLDLSHITGQEHSSGYRAPIVMANSIEADGIAEVWKAIAQHREHLAQSGLIDHTRASRLVSEVRSRVQRLLGDGIDEVMTTPPAQQELVDAVARTISPVTAAERIVAIVRG